MQSNDKIYRIEKYNSSHNFAIDFNGESGKYTITPTTNPMLIDLIFKFETILRTEMQHQQNMELQKNIEMQHLEIEKERLQIEKERLEIEKERLQMEKDRVFEEKIEKERLEIEKERLQMEKDRVFEEKYGNRNH